MNHLTTKTYEIARSTLTLVKQIYILYTEEINWVGQYVISNSTKQMWNLHKTTYYIQPKQNWIYKYRTQLVIKSEIWVKISVKMCSTIFFNKFGHIEFYVTNWILIGNIAIISTLKLYFNSEVLHVVRVVAEWLGDGLWNLDKDI